MHKMSLDTCTFHRLYSRGTISLRWTISKQLRLITAFMIGCCKVELQLYPLMMESILLSCLALTPTNPTHIPSSLFNTCPFTIYTYPSPVHAYLSPTSCNLLHYPQPLIPSPSSQYSPFNLSPSRVTDSFTRPHNILPLTSHYPQPQIPSPDLSIFFL